MFGVRQVLGLGAALTAGWLCKESYKGKVHDWQDSVDAHETDEMYEYAKYGWGHYSGQPTMDHWSHKLQGVRMFGLFGSNEDWNLVKTYVNGFVNDVLFPNMTPIALGIAGLYAAFGRNLHRPFVATYRYMASHSSSLRPLGTALWGTVKGAGSLAMTGMEKGMGQLAKGGLGSLALVGALAYGLYRFWRVDTHQEQHEYMKEFITGSGDHE